MHPRLQAGAHSALPPDGPCISKPAAQQVLLPLRSHCSPSGPPHNKSDGDGQQGKPCLPATAAAAAAAERLHICSLGCRSCSAQLPMFCFDERVGSAH